MTRKIAFRRLGRADEFELVENDEFEHVENDAKNRQDDVIVLIKTLIKSRN